MSKTKVTSKKGSTEGDDSIYAGGDVNSIYKKLEHRDHILELPDTYIGSVEHHDDELYILEDGKSPRIVKKGVTWVPGLVNIFNEILVNVTDQWTRLNGLKKRGVKKLTKIDVSIDEETGEISIQNNGDGIDAELLKEHGMYPVELIFGELLTSTNYNKKEQKVVGGKNGYGAKLTNIYSKSFKVTSVDRFRKRKVTVTYHNNMQRLGCDVEDYTGEPYTCVTFIPDYERFGLPGLTTDILGIMKKRVYDAAAWTDHRVKVSLNGVEVTTKIFADYVNLYLGDDEIYPRVYAKVNPRWEIIVTTSKDDHFEQVSFVNGINTIRGGKHVDHVVDQLRKGLTEAIQKKSKITIRKGCIKDQLMVFVKAQIVNPSFDSQTKETLTTSSRKFGSRCDVDKSFIDALVNKTPIIDRIIRLMEYKGSKLLNKSDGSKRSRIKIPKLDDANWAGGTKSKRCTLILTEGDSAKTMAIAGLSVVGRDAYGVFPLRGKILNVRDANVDKIGKNKEIVSLKQILGLKSNATYDMNTTPWPLRYGKIMIMTDQDTDGSHIKGLLFNIFHNMWPSLLREDFLTSMLTPVVKVSKGKKVLPFYNLTHYQDWKKANKNGKGWKIKYYKGLGTSTSKEAKEYFSDLRVVKYSVEGGSCDDSIDLAFNKKRADDRKTWLQNYDSSKVLNPDSLEVSYREFIHKELIHFSNEDLRRSVPSICDGLKPSQRKILYCAFKRGLTSEVKVAQLSGYVSEHSAYHHGETSLQMAIVGLAQDFVGANNINLFLPNGQFGSRLLGGKDSASPRYICTVLSPITSTLFPQSDFPLLEYLDDDGMMIEPNYYVPILPTALINGCKGIGTGYSTNIPNFDPLEIVDLIKRRMKDGPLEDVDIKPSYRGFNGKIIKKHKKDGEEVKNVFITKGLYRFPSISTIEITELPIGVWTEDYKEFLDSILIDTKKMKGQKLTMNSKQFIKSYVNHSTETEVRFLIKLSPSILNKMKLAKDPEPGVTFIEKRLRLATNSNCTNMHLYNSTDSIQKYNSVSDIINEFYKVRLDLYVRRKEHIETTLQKDLDIIEAKVQFIKDYIADVIIIKNVPGDKLHARMEELGYPKFDTRHKPDNPLYNPSYDYLNLRLYMLTKEKVEELLELCKNKQLELAELKGKTPKDLWTEDLGEFLKVYKKLYSVKKTVKTTVVKSPMKLKKRKTRVKKTAVVV